MNNIKLLLIYSNKEYDEMLIILKENRKLQMRLTVQFVKSRKL